MFCPVCSVQVLEDIKFCKSCGTDLLAVRDALAGRSSRIDWSKTWVTEMFLTQEEKDRRHGVTPEMKRNNEIKAGVITTLAGLGAMIFFRFFLEAVANSEGGGDADIIRHVWLIGIVPFLIGIGILFNGLVLSKASLRSQARLPFPERNPARPTNQLAEPPAVDFSVIEQTTANLAEKREKG